MAKKGESDEEPHQTSELEESKELEKLCMTNDASVLGQPTPQDLSGVGMPNVYAPSIQGQQAIAAPQLQQY